MDMPEFDPADEMTKYMEDGGKLVGDQYKIDMNKDGKMESVGVNDDMAMALALANWGTKEFRGNVILLDDDDMPGFTDWITTGTDVRPSPGWFTI